MFVRGVLGPQFGGRKYESRESTTGKIIFAQIGCVQASECVINTSASLYVSAWICCLSAIPSPDGVLFP